MSSSSRGCHSASVAGDALVAAIALSLVALATALLLLCRRMRRADKENSGNTSGGGGDGDDDESSVTAMLHAARPRPLRDIESATAGFHRSHVIHDGPHATVYKAVSPSGDVFAAKRVHPDVVLLNPGVAFGSAVKSFSFAGRHPNVVPVLGYSEAPGERIILTEYVAGVKTLDICLHGSAPNGTPFAGLLRWQLRIRIAAGAARGIAHLHGATALGIVHGRIKPANIMLDANFCARVSDYALPFPLQTNNRSGYDDGEGPPCKESDVYAFGVVLLELLSGRRGEEGTVVEWAVPMIRAGRVGEVADRRVAAPRDMRPIERMAKVATACVGNGRRCRPSMAQVAAILGSLQLPPCI
ncbi:Serine/threonine-protein kinase-like protein CCR1 [Ananas comosus]|uniref:Serine/threonine-protein kinase-like protein CCR1 n=1 Tax=Ananas comosus TaxID=4615 RepID=A0A199UFI0_ANACO|nr:Serine/threonine-protein kinase-like protein CCR1 [Ananas comosus]